MEYQNKDGISSGERNDFFRTDSPWKLSTSFPCSNICEQVCHLEKWGAHNYSQAWVGAGASPTPQTRPASNKCGIANWPLETSSHTVYLAWEKRFIGGGASSSIHGDWLYW